MATDRLIDPIAAYASPLIPADATGEIALSPDPQPIDLDLHQPGCPPTMRSACDQVVKMSWPNAGSGNWTRVSVIAPDVVIVREDADRLLRIADGSDIAPVTLDPAIGMPVAFASNHVNTHFGIGTTGNAFQLGNDGGLLAVLRLPFSAQGLTVGRDGHAYAYGSDHVVELVRGATIATSLPKPPAGFNALFSVSSTRSAALANGSVYVLRDNSWSKEQAEIPADASLFGDEYVLGFVSAGGVTLRNETRHIWQDIGSPKPTLLLYSAVAIGHGRVLATGDGGTSGIWDGTTWCLIDSATVLSLNSVDVQGDGKAAFTATDASDQGSRQLIRFDLSALGP
jgi:hypothetical protein